MTDLPSTTALPPCLANMPRLRTLCLGEGCTWRTAGEAAPSNAAMASAANVGASGGYAIDTLQVYTATVPIATLVAALRTLPGLRSLWLRGCGYPRPCLSLEGYESNAGHTRGPGP